MKFRLAKVFLALFFLSNANILSAQNYDNYEFLGKVLIRGEKAKDVTIKAFDRDTCFSNYTTENNGKFSFVGDAEENYILQFEKEGYITKRIIINTHNTNDIEKRIKKYRFDINLTKKRKDNSSEIDIAPVSIIELSASKKEFKSKRYNENKQVAFNFNEAD